METPVPARWQSVRAGVLTAHLSRSSGVVNSCARHLSRYLEAEPDIEVDVFGPASPGRDFPEWSPLTPRTSIPLGPRFFSYAPGLARRLVASDLDLVHLHGLWMHTSAASAAFTRRTGRPHLISPHGMLEGESDWKRRFAARICEDANIRSAASLHALTPAEAAAIREHGYQGSICIIPSGVELPHPGQPPLAPPWWTKTEPNAKTLLFMGRLAAEKNLRNLLIAWSQVDAEVRADWRLVIAGWDDHGHQAMLRRMTLAFNIQSTVTFPGPVFGDDRKAAIQHCHGCILPSLTEQLPSVVLDAWAYGKPVLMTPACNLPQGFAAGAALAIEPHVESIQEGLEDFIFMPDSRRAEMGAAARSLAESQFSWPVVAGKMAAVYRWLAGRGPQPESVRTDL